jgi:hypothetical protein
MGEADSIKASAPTAPAKYAFLAALLTSQGSSRMHLLEAGPSCAPFCKAQLVAASGKSLYGGLRN